MGVRNLNDMRCEGLMLQSRICTMIGGAIGGLLGGLCGVAVGWMFKSETTVIACYASFFAFGTFAGASFSRRWQTLVKQNAEGHSS